MKFKKYLLIFSLFMILLCCVSAISAASDDVINDTLSEVDSGDDSISVSNDKQVTGVDDAALVTQVNDDELSGQSPNENEIKASNSDSEDALTINGAIIEAKYFNITETDTAENNVVVIWTKLPLAMMDLNGHVEVLVNDELKNSTYVTHGKFPNGEQYYSFSLNDLAISNYNNEYHIKVMYYDNDIEGNVATTLCEGQLSLTFMDYLRLAGSNVNAAAVEYHLANDFKGTITAKLNGEDLGEIFCDSWQYNDTKVGYQIGTLKLDPSKVRLTDNKVIIRAYDPIKGVEEKEIIFNCSPSLVRPGDFYWTGDPSKFFSIGEEFQIGIEVPKEITGTLKVYTTDENLNKSSLLASANIVDGLAIANVSLNTEGDNWLYLEYNTNKGDGFDDYYVEIVKNSNNITVTVSPTEFIVGDSNVTVNLNSSSPGTLYIYKDGWAQSFYETKGNHTIEYLSVGTHIIRVTFEGDDDYYSKQFTINVKPWTPSGEGNSSENTTISTKIIPVSSKVNAVYGGNYAIATLKDSSGKAIAGVKVTVSFSNGKKATVTTDKNGKIIVTVTGLVPLKTYKATITFAGNAKYAKSTKQMNVYVKKATPKITAKAKTFKKSDKTKKYSVKLTVDQKVKVAIKVNKKTYYAYTTAKGTATFKLTKLTKKGKYTATVSSVTNKYYNKAKSVNVKITVK